MADCLLSIPYVDKNLPFTPDHRNWGGGTHTSQNQRLVYFPMFKSGDFDMLPSQLDFYLRALGMQKSELNFTGVTKALRLQSNWNNLVCLWLLPTVGIVRRIFQKDWNTITGSNINGILNLNLH
jgi:hypothetical protein